MLEAQQLLCSYEDETLQLGTAEWRDAFPASLEQPPAPFLLRQE